MKIQVAVFWVVTTYSDMAARSSDLLISCHITAYNYNPEDHDLNDNEPLGSMEGKDFLD
jgi:hypothetical protein